MNKIIVERFGKQEEGYLSISASTQINKNSSIDLIYFVPSKTAQKIKAYRMTEYLGNGKFEAVEENDRDILSKIEEKLSKAKNKSL